MAHNEQVFTPQYIVDSMLDDIDYCDDNIRKKHIIDNSCGNGNFLIRIIERYINVCIEDNLSEDEIIDELKTYIHGIEINYSVYEEALSRVHNYMKKRGFKNYCFDLDIRCGDTLFINDYDNKMDYVVGNPPYCRIHDLNDEQRNRVKEFKFAQGGMTDLYLVFFEISINMLNKYGKLAYITPNSWMTSKAGTNFRKWIKDTNKLHAVIQLGHKKIFNEATTFNNITIIDNKKNSNNIYYKYSVEEEYNMYRLDKCFINDAFYLGNFIELKQLKEIIENKTKEQKVFVKNGFATLNDKLFIFNENDDENNIIDNNIIDIYKASTGKTYKGIYPFDKNGKPLKFTDFNKQVQEALIKRAKILKTDITNNIWFIYGRYQGIKDMSKYRIAVNNLINNEENSVKIKLLKPGDGIFSGFYITFDNDDELLSEYDRIVSLLKSKTFRKYISLLGKYKNGGYFTFSSKDLQIYLNYNL